MPTKTTKSDLVRWFVVFVSPAVIAEDEGLLPPKVVLQKEAHKTKDRKLSKHIPVPQMSPRSLLKPSIANRKDET